MSQLINKEFSMSLRGSNYEKVIFEEEDVNTISRLKSTHRNFDFIANILSVTRVNDRTSLQGKRWRGGLTKIFVSELGIKLKTFIN